MIKYWLYLAVWSVLFVSPLAYAQNSEKSQELIEMSLEEILNIEVFVESASNVESDIKKQPASVTTISHTQLELSGARTLIEAINIFVPGFFMVEDQDDVIAGFRGLAPDNNSKVMLLLNGKNINTEWFWGPPSAILNNTDLEYIEKVEVIRGPGSVILGQSALLGVINVITKKRDSAKKCSWTDGNSLSGFYGKDDFRGGTSEFSLMEKDYSLLVHASSQSYEGQKTRHEGFAMTKNEGYAAGTVADVGTRLKKTSNNVIMINSSWKWFNADFFYADHEKDLYNFYRDRNVLAEKLISFSLGGKYSFSEKIQIKADSTFTVDDSSLKSVDGFSMGGTRENRLGNNIIANFNNLIPFNRLAIGAEHRNYRFGLSNFDGNNFINNVADENARENIGAYIEEANNEKTLVYPENINLFSAFAEDFFSYKVVDVFAAIRFDNHPYWGTNFSPRGGIIVSPREDLKMRLSYQSGFRGAVGLHYTGGYRKDGFLSNSNFSEVENAKIPVFDEAGGITGYEKNIDEVKPEKMDSFEAALNYDFTKQIALSATGFYNIIKNIIDVGVIYRDPEQVKLSSIGTDTAGDWNGFWYYKNISGSLHQAGGEFALTFLGKQFQSQISHSIVKIIEEPENKGGSMYTTASGHARAYPENITRINITAKITNSLSFGTHALYYYQWLSASGQKIKGNLMTNLALKYAFTNDLDATLNLTNLLGQHQLYPMNTTANNYKISEGTPSYEETTGWLRLNYNF